MDNCSLVDNDPLIDNYPLVDNYSLKDNSLAFMQDLDMKESLVRTELINNLNMKDIILSVQKKNHIKVYIKNLKHIANLVVYN